MAGGICIGQVWRDCNGDGRRIPQSMGSGVFRNGRTVRIQERETDGRWLVVTLTDCVGKPCGDNGRRSRLKESTLGSHYEMQEASS